MKFSLFLLLCVFWEKGGILAKIRVWEQGTQPLNPPPKKEKNVSAVRITKHITMLHNHCLSSTRAQFRVQSQMHFALKLTPGAIYNPLVYCSVHPHMDRKLCPSFTFRNIDQVAERGLVSELVILPIIFKALQHVIKQINGWNKSWKANTMVSEKGVKKNRWPYALISEMKATTVSQIWTKEKQTSDREGKLYTLICTLYSMQLRNMANTSRCQRPFMAPVTELPRLAHIGVKKHTQAEPIRNCKTLQRVYL